MDATAHFAVLLAIAVGIVSAGLTGSLWQLATGSDPDFAMLFESDLLVPLRVAAVVLAAPWILLNAAFWWLIAYPPVALPLLIVSLGWSFLQGVFILTQIFGLS